jgi:hypothetical protein
MNNFAMAILEGIAAERLLILLVLIVLALTAGFCIGYDIAETQRQIMHELQSVNRFERQMEWDEAERLKGMGFEFIPTDEANRIMEGKTNG